MALFYGRHTTADCSGNIDIRITNIGIIFYLFTFFIAYKKISYKVLIRFCGVDKSPLIEFDDSNIEGVLDEVK